ncbi:MAG: FAD/NAD(P)-binding protein [Vicinamibacteria bacterium]|nr:FAD/NAD(P)-binding protein [Vicinamibacteria bacterium]
MSITVEKQADLKDPQEALYRPLLCKMVSVKELTPTEKLFRLERLDGRPFGHRPGQFVQVSIPGIGEAPISVSSSPSRGSYLELGVRRTGVLTGALHEMIQPGDVIGFRGPFGTYFDVDAMKGRDLILISGGCGLAPMRALIQYIEDHRDQYGKVTILYGAKSPIDILYKDELAQWVTSTQLNCQYTVDDVPEGTCWDANVGLITQLIPPLDIDPARSLAVIVGPPIMYRFVLQELKKKNLPINQIIVSLERYMKCGVGKCGHCTIEHLYCCMDGPVFWLNDVINLAGAL